jgi:uncharacterized protein (TIGR03086 family)
VTYLRTVASTDSLRNSADGFRRVVARIGDDQWQLDTPCDGWTVRQLVGHVAAGCQMAATLADGGDRQAAIAVLGVDHLGDEPVAAVDRALQRQQVAFDRPDIGDQGFQHPAGDMPGVQVLLFRVTDLLVHQWDLARAIGVDETLDPVLVDEVLRGIAPIVPMMASSGVFGSGPSGSLADDAPAQSRLLDAMGRRP